MGRVAKYKKIKNFDPFSKKNRGKVDLEQVGVWGLGDDGRKPKKRSRKSELLRQKKIKNKLVNSSGRTENKRKKEDSKQKGFDLPPDEEDDFDLKDLLGSVKKQKVQSSDQLLGESMNSDTAKKSNQAGASALNDFLPKTDKEERKIARMLKLDEKQLERSTQKAEMKEKYERRPGESRRQYEQRTKEETRHIIQRGKQEQDNPEKRQRKKEFLKQRKAKKKKGGNKYREQNDDDEGVTDRNDEEDSSFVTGERAVAALADQVRFGEQAQQPPVFRQLPRGAVSKSKSGETKTKLTNEKIKAEQQTMEIMRRKVQAQYAQIKAKRKEDGDFHL